ncbi:hypothetical protein FA95DRAFT_1613494 [Auriscalpium vulgare]|uniref:Uncharacterized protein n=1 Tax=Auriscalpium vulgare TaxID=40419 RepID=A0ACB8R2H0_9AGAM|nr:hypothetical protein FA95DRAFT_1613494 [Auriscalpium vulgare]
MASFDFVTQLLQPAVGSLPIKVRVNCQPALFEIFVPPNADMTTTRRYTKYAVRQWVATTLGLPQMPEVNTKSMTIRDKYYNDRGNALATSGRKVVRRVIPNDGALWATMDAQFALSELAWPDGPPEAQGGDEDEVESSNGEEEEDEEDEEMDHLTIVGTVASSQQQYEEANNARVDRLEETVVSRMDRLEKAIVALQELNAGLEGRNIKQRDTVSALPVQPDRRLTVQNSTKQSMPT